MTRNIDADVASSAVVSLQPMPLGKPKLGRPLGTGPRIDTPCVLRSKPQLTAIAPTTATRPPGIAFSQRPNTISVASTATETARVAPEVWPISFSVSQNLITVPLTRPASTSGDGTPSIPPN